jgi:hypothetical protein
VRNIYVRCAAALAVPIWLASPATATSVSLASGSFTGEDLFNAAIDVSDGFEFLATWALDGSSLTFRNTGINYGALFRIDPQVAAPPGPFSVEISLQLTQPTSSDDRSLVAGLSNFESFTGFEFHVEQPRGQQSATHFQCAFAVDDCPVPILPFFDDPIGRDTILDVSVRINVDALGNVTSQYTEGGDPSQVFSNVVSFAPGSDLILAFFSGSENEIYGIDALSYSITAPAPVPIPASLPLLVMAIGGTGFVVRRIQSAAPT